MTQMTRAAVVVLCIALAAFLLSALTRGDSISADLQMFALIAGVVGAGLLAVGVVRRS